MREGDRYEHLVYWSDEDRCYIGQCPELMGGGVHGDDPEEVFRHLRQVVDEWVRVCKQDGVPLPEAKHALA
jgi:predicted RNase H-like HicB family nuclease